jgi:hypothetical protein
MHEGGNIRWPVGDQLPPPGNFLPIIADMGGKQSISTQFWLGVDPPGQTGTVIAWLVTQNFMRRP